MTDKPPMAITPDMFKTAVDKLDALIPNLKMLVTRFQANPLLFTTFARLVPGASAVVPFLIWAGPLINKSLDWLQRLTDAIQEAEQQAGNGN